MVNNPEKKSIAEEVHEQVMKSQGTKKMITYFENLVKDEMFRDRVIEIRTLEDGAPRPFALARDKELKAKYDDMISDMCSTYKLPINPWYEVIDNIIQTDSWDFDYKAVGFDVCNLELDDEDPIYPIKINISPYATREDMIDFIKTNFKEFLLPLQNHFKEDGINIGKYRKRSKEDIYDFIFDNKQFTAKEIVRMVGKKFGEAYGYDQINKIIQREKKRRSVK